MKETTYYSWSMIKCFMECPMQFYHSYIEKLSPRVKSRALCAGGAMARGLEAYRRTNDRDAAVNALIESAKEPDSSLVVSKADDPKRSIERLIEILWAYMDKYPEDPDMLIRMPGSDAAEITFSFEVFPYIGFRGVIDALFWMNKDKKTIAPIEDKTTSRMGDSFFAYHKDSPQVLWYMYTIHRLGLFDLYKSTPACIINGMYIHDKNYNFQRDITIKNKATILRAEEDLVKWIMKVEDAKFNNMFPRDTRHCHEYGGCDFLCLRDVEGKMYDRIRDNNFMIRTHKAEDDNGNIP